MQKHGTANIIAAILGSGLPQFDIDASYRRARLRNAYDGNPSGISRDERAKRKKKAKIAKASRKRNRR